MKFLYSNDVSVTYREMLYLFSRYKPADIQDYRKHLVGQTRLNTAPYVAILDRLSADPARLKDVESVIPLIAAELAPLEPAYQGVYTAGEWP